MSAERDGLNLRRVKQINWNLNPQKRLEHVFFVAVMGRMQLPDRWIYSHCEQALPVGGYEWPKLKKMADQVRL